MSTTQLPTGDSDLVRLIGDILGDASESDDGFARSVWADFAASDIQMVGFPESLRGAGGTFEDVMAVAMECARHGVAIPFVENFVGQWVRTEQGHSVDSALTIMCEGVAQADGSILLQDVPWGRHAQRLLVRLEAKPGVVREVRTEDGFEWSWRSDLAGQPSDDIVIPKETFVSGQILKMDLNHLARRINVLRAAQIAGGIRGCYELSAGYAAAREQFGRRLDAFPAVQRHLVELAQASAITRVGAWRAAGEMASGSSALASRTLGNHYAREALNCAHQVHGAIGMTREYPLHRFTTRLHMWRLMSETAGQPAALLGAELNSGSAFLDLIWSSSTNRDLS